MKRKKIASSHKATSSSMRKAAKSAFRAFDFSQVREDPSNRIHSAALRKAKPSRVTSIEIPWDAFYRHLYEEKKTDEKTGPPKRPGKVHPLLAEWVSTRSSDEREQIIINFRDDLLLPRFPEPIAEEKRSSAGNRRVLEQTEKLIEEIKARRSESYTTLTRQLTSQYKAKVTETFWLIKGVLVEMPLSSVTALAERDDVLFIEPRYGQTKPPANANANDDVDDGRGRIVSDPYFNLGLSGGFIGLLDTGVRFTHTQFVSPSNIDFRRDCVNGGSNCNLTTNPGFDPSDSDWNHGTSSAAIITGNVNLGAAFRGVTGVTLDSFKVYTAAGLDTDAAVRGFQAAVAVADRVIVAEMQDTGGNETSAVCNAADNAFDTGAVIIAANGNNGSSASTVNGPALSHKSIGVGAFNLESQTQYANQSRGPAPDNRYKPDIQAPNDAETADAASNTALDNFGGTSGATPFAAGAATLLRNWLRGTSFSIDPGQVYAQLILSGQQPYPFNNTSGAGALRLPTDGWAWWGKVNISNGLTSDIPINVNNTNVNLLDGALWWPETASQAHNDVDLYLVDPSGAVRASSISIPSVFERARVSGNVANGTWKLRIRGYSVNGVQTVYWAAVARF